jgi:hypothetical protein
VDEIAVNRLVMGGGGGAATSNNATGSPGNGLASSGAAGGGIVFVRAGEVAGAGSIAANGASANSSVANDGSGGGGGGGTVLITAIRAAGGSLAISADGGNGGSNTGGGSAHGPGGGGGGGYILNTSTISVSASVAGGGPGTTQNGGSQGASYGATAGSSGTTALIAAASVPGVSSGCECTPTVAKSFATSPVAPGAPSRMTIAVTNNNPTLSLTTLAFTDNYPAGLRNTASPATNISCGGGTLSATASGTSLSLSNGSVAAGSTCSYSVNTTPTSGGNKVNSLAAGSISWRYGTFTQTSLEAVSATLSVSAPLTVAKASVAFMDPINGTSNPKLIPGSYVAYGVTVTNPTSVAVDSNSIVIVDTTPANLQLYVGSVPGGSGPVLFQNGSPSSGLTYTFSSLASTTDDLDFSSTGGSSWNYVPTMNALGVDPAVTHIRIRPKGAMAPGSSFTLLFGYRIS